MNLLISRILSYCYGTLLYNENYKFCMHLIYNYSRYDEVTMDELIDYGFIEQEITDFCNLLGFIDFEDFKQKLLDDKTVRLGQIRARLFGIDEHTLLERFDKNIQKVDFYQDIEKLCKIVYNAKRVILVGAIYPTSLAIEFQTDLISFGKPVIQFHHFDEELQVTSDDVIIYMSATGRAVQSCKEHLYGKNSNEAITVLLTQNPVYKCKQYQVSSYTYIIPGRFDGLDFNYQLLTFFDLLRVEYFKNYYL